MLVFMACMVTSDYFRITCKYCLLVTLIADHHIKFCMVPLFLVLVSPKIFPPHQTTTAHR
jgi:hypothetical protein